MKVSAYPQVTNSQNLTLYAIQNGVSSKVSTGGPNGLPFLDPNGYIPPSNFVFGMFNSVSSGILSGGVLSIGSPQTTFNITAGTGVIINNYTNPLAPTYTIVTWNAMTNVVDSYPGASRTYIGINASGAAVQQSTPFTPDQLRDIIEIGRTIHNYSLIVAVANSQSYMAEPYLQFKDLAYSIGVVTIGGNIYSANGASLQINKSSGSSFSAGANYSNSNKNPNITTDAAITACNFRYKYRNGSGGFLTGNVVNLIDVAHYDNGTGTLSTIANPNSWSIQRIYFSPSNSADRTIVMYGQNVYTSQSAALAALNYETFVQDSNLFPEYSLRGWLVVSKNATDLSSSTQAIFVSADKFGAIPSGNFSASSTTTLQNAYNNSTNPEIILNSTVGTFVISDNSTPLGTDLLSITDNLKTTTYFSVSASGVVTSTPLSLQTSGSNKTISLTDTGANGSNLYILGNGSTTPSKTIRAYSGDLEVMNDAYTTAILTLDDGGTLNITGTGYATHWIELSDSTLKYNEFDITLDRALKFLNTTFSKQYKLKSSDESDIGFIADNIENSEPLLIKQHKDGVKGVKYTRIPAFHHVILKSHETRLLELENKIANMLK